MISSVSPIQRLVVQGVLACILTIAPLHTARADYYTYTDRNGVVCMTNRADKVPAKYRSGMKVIREETWP